MSSQRVIHSTRCSAFGHPEFEVTVDIPIPECDANWLIELLECGVVDGRRFADGETIAIGIALLLVKSKSTRLSIYDPDFSSMPIHWIEGASYSLKLVRLQKDVAESVGLLNDHDQPSLRESLIVGRDVGDSTRSFFLSREKPDDRSSGWFVGNADTKLDYDDPENLGLISVYEGMVLYPQISMFMGLPYGTEVILLDDGEFEISNQGKLVSLTRCSFLDAAIRKAIGG